MYGYLMATLIQASLDACPHGRRLEQEYYVKGDSAWCGSCAQWRTIVRLYPREYKAKCKGRCVWARWAGQSKPNAELYANRHKHPAEILYAALDGSDSSVVECGMTDAKRFRSQSRGS